MGTFEPAELMDKDAAAKTFEPIVTAMINQLVDQLGIEAVRAMLPVKVVGIVNLYDAAGKPITNAKAESRIEVLDGVN